MRLSPRTVAAGLVLIALAAAGASVIFENQPKQIRPEDCFKELAGLQPVSSSAQDGSVERNYVVTLNFDQDGESFVKQGRDCQPYPFLGYGQPSHHYSFNNHHGSTIYITAVKDARTLGQLDPVTTRAKEKPSYGTHPALVRITEPKRRWWPSIFRD
jgi:hypothetical protein